MDEQSQFRELLAEVRLLLPPAVATTCESLNEHGEWELALGHCQFHLQSSGAVLSERASVLLSLCSARLTPRRSQELPNNAFKGRRAKRARP
jgi:hypothetical protein